MSVTELDTFVSKFQQLWNAGYNAHLDIDAHAGNALVGLLVQLGHVPGPFHHQVPPPFSSIQKKTESSSCQRCCARHTAERIAAAEKASGPEEKTNKQPNDHIEAIDKAAKENYKETMIYENFENFDDSVENDSKKEILVMENQLDM